MVIKCRSVAYGSRPAMIRAMSAAFALLVCAGQAAAAAAPNFKFYDWTYSGSTWRNTSSSGTMSCTMANPGSAWSAPTSAFALPSAISTQSFTTEFNVAPASLYNSLVCTFPATIPWVTGGMLVLGNIHNYFAYALAAWDINGNRIDVTKWTTPPGLSTEYLTGGAGYFATSNTIRTPFFQSLFFSVKDPSANPSSGQGGIIPLMMTQGAYGPADRVGKIQIVFLAIDFSKVGSSPGADLIVFNVATPIISK